MGPPLTKLIHDLNNEQNFLTRVQAISKLSWHNDGDIIDLLIQALKDPYFKVREKAAHELNRIYDPRVIEPLIAAVTDIPCVRDAALESLKSRTLSQELQNQVSSYLDTYASYTRRSELKQKFKRPPETSFPSLLAASRESDFLMREAAAHTLGQCHTEEALICLAHASDDLYLSVREAATRGIQLYEGPLSTPLLKEVMSTTNWPLFDSLLYMLHRREYTALVHVLIHLLQNDNFVIRRRARVGLSNINGDQSLPALVDSLAYWDSEAHSTPAYIAAQLYKEGLHARVTHFSEAMKGLMGSIVERDWPAGIEALHRLADKEEWRHLAYFSTTELDRRNQYDVGAVLDRTFEIQKKYRQAYLCTKHLARFNVHYHQGHKFLGCRICKQTHTSIRVDNVTAVLDSSAPPVVEEDDMYRVNWIKRKQRMDFDAVEVGVCPADTITDFCIEIGNDTDTYRTRRYQNTVCYVQKGLSLSPETTNLLNRQFKRVVTL